MPIRTKTNTNLSASYSLAASTLEDIDYALFNYINDKLNIYVDSNAGFHKVPVIFATPERAYQIKDDPLLRPDGRALEYPLISIVRQGINKNPSNKGRYGVGIPPFFEYYNRGGSIDFARVVNQDKTKNFANANSIRKSASKTNPNRQTFPSDNPDVVYETLSVPMPAYVEVAYVIDIISEYRQQMNQILAPLIAGPSTPAIVKIEHEGNKYEAFIDAAYGEDGNAAGLDTDERLFRSSVPISVLGYLIGADKNQDTPQVVIKESAVKVVMGREHVIVGDEPYFHVNKKDKYRP